MGTRRQNTVSYSLAVAIQAACTNKEYRLLWEGINPRTKFLEFDDSPIGQLVEGMRPVILIKPNGDIEALNR